MIATADIRSQFGSKLGAVYALQVIASFGVGPARIDIRVIAPQGPAAFRTELNSDFAARKSSGAQLLGNAQITESAGARAQLTSGLVDSRLLTTIAFLVVAHPVDIVSFGGMAPGAAPGVPLRTVYLAESDSAAHLTGGAYAQWLESALRAQSPPYVPLSVGSVQPAAGPPVLRIVFAAPSPLGLAPLLIDERTARRLAGDVMSAIQPRCAANTERHTMTSQEVATCNFLARRDDN